jgi:4-carboxymuconolactone decarboxylase
MMRETGTDGDGTASILSEAVLDEGTRALVALAAALAAGREQELVARSRAVVAAQVPPVWVDELLLQSVLMLGYPRALAGAGVWRSTTGIRGPATDPSLSEEADLWRRRGEETCRRIYGATYDRLRSNVRDLHPALDAWMVEEGYGKVLSRPGLDLARRELCTVAQLAVLGSPRQLHSHFRGALHAGAGPGHLEAALTAAAEVAGEAGVAEARRLWRDLAPRAPR